MPVKREDGFTKPRRTKAVPLSSKATASKRAATHTDIDIIKALKENNASLAAALDDSKKNYRDLHEDFVLLQSERQELLERVFSIESQLCDQQKLISDQIRPVFKLLSQTDKSLFAARQSLSTVLTAQPSLRHHARTYSPSLSPIHSSSNDLFDIKPHSSTLLDQPTAARRGHKKTKSFPKTPHPVVAISSPSENPVHLMSNFEPKMLDFDNLTSCQHAETPLPKSVEPGDLDQFKAVVSLNSICEEEIADSSQHSLNKYSESVAYDAGIAAALDDRPRRACTSLSIVNPTRKKKMSVKAGRKSNTRNETKNGSGKTTVSSARPRRACSTLNIFYQEPSLKSKLTFDENASSERVLNESSVIHKTAKTRTKVKSALQDVTNKV